ncbi:MAG: hypothetical protein HY264_00565 [Chloroflexi bacterium]|nr:hypothetical protein [Chloroflexota bacterium]
MADLLRPALAGRVVTSARARTRGPRTGLVIGQTIAVAVCFDAPVVDLSETRAAALHPTLGKLGPNLLDAEFDARALIRSASQGSERPRTTYWWPSCQRADNGPL